MTRTILTPLFLCTSLALAGCDDAATESAPAKSDAKSDTKVASASTTPAAKPKADAPAPAKVEAKAAEPEKPAEPAALVLEQTDLPGLGKLKLPKGFKSTAEKHWSYDLGNYESINVSWEPHGAPNLKKAESLSKILATAETVKSSTTLPSGFHEIERVRASDGFTFIAVFGPDWYVKCVAPAKHMETCREIVRSKA